MGGCGQLVSPCTCRMMASNFVLFSMKAAFSLSSSALSSSMRAFREREKGNQVMKEGGGGNGGKVCIVVWGKN